MSLSDTVAYDEALQSILTWQGRYHDQEGGSPRARLNHCTRVVLTSANSPNVGISTAQFLVVGDCVRALPSQKHVQVTPYPRATERTRQETVLDCRLLKLRLL